MSKDSQDETLLDVTGPRTQPRLISDVGLDERYNLGSVLGRGGMGEVRSATDLRIHRDVAVKLMRVANADDDTKARFLREAQVQGRLEHPAIPPVHDVGTDSQGQPYFVMKKLAGTTLHEVLEARSSDLIAAKFPRRTLLSRLVDVCLAIEFAHSRGIIHRDLKPANIMLGEYGETYVLDWGLARVTGDDATGLHAVSGEHEAGHTAAGALLGTPGYMAPEQARGEPVDARADVYALGCVLYEILTGAQALPRGLAAIEVTLTTPELRPSKRVDVPPELDDLTARATAQDAATRPTARELADGIQAYLDGDRDLERRRQLATVHADRARAAVARSGDDARAEAMREASRAIVLDATNSTAQDILAKLVLEAPAEVPTAALAEADLARGTARQGVLRWACATYASVVGLVGLLFTFPLKHVWPIVTTMVLCSLMSGLFYALSRAPLPMRSPKFVLVLVMNTLLLISGAFIFGPLLITPIFVVGSLAGMVMAPTAYSPLLLVGAHAVAFGVPLVLELLGLTPSTFAIVDGSVVMTPYAVELTPLSALAFFVLAVVSQFANSTSLAYSERSMQKQALDRVHAQSWHFKQLLPAAGERSLPAAPDPRRAPPSDDA